MSKSFWFRLFLREYRLDCNQPVLSQKSTLCEICEYAGVTHFFPCTQCFLDLFFVIDKSFTCVSSRSLFSRRLGCIAAIQCSFKTPQFWVIAKTQACGPFYTCDTFQMDRFDFLIVIRIVLAWVFQVISQRNYWFVWNHPLLNLNP